MEDVVDALELAGPLEGQDVEWLLDDAQPDLIAARVATDRAQRRVADVEAAIAEDDLVAHVDEGGRQRPGLRVRRSQQVVGQSLGGLGPDAWQARERLDESRDRFDERGGHVVEAYRPGIFRPPVTAAIFSASAAGAMRGGRR